MERRALLLGVGYTAVASDWSWAKSQLGSYWGSLILQPGPDGREMRTISDFGFVDPMGVRWPVPPGTMTDGASIPQAFWSLIGGPFEGKYRTAAVVHDYYCDVRVRPWKKVDRMFFDAMLASGVDIKTAKLLYAGVLYGGPRWNQQTIDNQKLPIPSIAFHDYTQEIIVTTDAQGNKHILKQQSSQSPSTGAAPISLHDFASRVQKADPNEIEALAESVRGSGVETGGKVIQQVRLK